MAQVRRVRRLERDAPHELPVLVGGDGRRQDVDVLFGECGADVGEHARAVDALHLDGHQEGAAAGARPGHVDDALGLLTQGRRVGAVRPVHGDTVAGNLKIY